jgi:hypothetical protein
MLWNIGIYSKKISQFCSDMIKMNFDISDIWKRNKKKTESLQNAQNCKSENVAGPV